MITNPVSKLFVILAVLTAAFATLSFVEREAPSKAELSWPSRPVISPASLARHLNYRAYILYRQGEWAAAEASDLSAYHRSERTLASADAGLAIYQQSERNLTGAQNDLMAYHQSERTRTGLSADLAAYVQSEKTLLPVRDLSAFTSYQRSEWFGK
jgi:hypothetical protein